MYIPPGFATLCPPLVGSPAQWPLRVTSCTAVGLLTELRILVGQYFGFQKVETIWEGTITIAKQTSHPLRLETMWICGSFCKVQGPSSSLLCSFKLPFLYSHCSSSSHSLLHACSVLTRFVSLLCCFLLLRMVFSFIYLC